MAKTIRVGVVALLIAALTALAGVAGAQESKPAASQAENPKPVLVPLKLQLVLSRYQGDKKISSVPYLLWLTANTPSPTRLRMGVQVPVPQGPPTSSATSYTLKDVGTNIDCSAATVPDSAAYRLNLTVTDSGVSISDKPTPGGLTLPSYRNFTSTFTILLRDGQTGQYTSATDPISGEVLKIDATLNVLK